MNLKNIVLFVFCFAVTSLTCFSQQGTVILNQDKKITELLTLKKEMNKSETDSDRYKIQIYNGNRSGAYAAQKEFGESFANWNASMHYEEPNFKIWAGNFRTRLEADRALKRIRLRFNNAFIFRPKKF